MPRKTSRKPSVLPKKKYNQNNKPIINQPTQQSSSQSLMGSVVQGAAIGAGASMGSVAINGMLHGNNTESNFQEENKTSELMDCKKIFEQFNKCVNNFNDINNCKFYLDTYNNCVNSKNI